MDVNDIRIHYLDWGGKGDVLLFVPGIGRTAHSFDAIAPHFTDRYRALVVTRRWHGASEKTDLTFDLDTLAADLAAFLDHFTDDPAIVASWSFAGLEVTRLARTRPDLVKALVFLDANYDPSVFADAPLPPGAPEIDSIFPSIAAAADVFRPFMPRVDSALFERNLQSEFHRTEAGVYAWQLPPHVPRVAAHLRAHVGLVAGGLRRNRSARDCDPCRTGRRAGGHHARPGISVRPRGGDPSLEP